MPIGYCSHSKLIQFSPYDNDKLYLGFSFGTRLIEKKVLNTSISVDKFIPDDTYKLVQQVVMGYDFCRYFGIEGQITFVPSSVYHLTPNRDSINRKIYTFSALVKLMIPLNRFRFYLGGGGAIIYTLAPNFEIFIPPEIYTPSNFSNYIDGKWGRQGFYRPKVLVGLGFYFSKRVLVSLVYSRIFGTGTFEAHMVSYSGKDNEFIVNRNYLPNLNVLVVMFTMKV